MLAFPRFRWNRQGRGRGIYRRTHRLTMTNARRLAWLPWEQLFTERDLYVEF